MCSGDKKQYICWELPADLEPVEKKEIEEHIENLLAEAEARWEAEGGS